MILSATSRRLLALVVSLLPLLCGRAAAAAVSFDTADFNNDGIADRIVVNGPPHASIVVGLSGGTSQVLRLSHRPIVVRVLDIDHDGDVDLAAVSDNHRIFLWLNKGGHGELKRVKLRHRLARGHDIVTRRGPMATAPTSDGGHDATPSYSDDTGSASDIAWTDVVSPPPPVHHRPLSSTARLIEVERSRFDSRAPPVS